MPPPSVCRLGRVRRGACAREVGGDRPVRTPSTGPQHHRFGRATSALALDNGDMEPDLAWVPDGSVIKKKRRADNHGVRPFITKVLGMFEHKGRATYNKVRNHKRTASDCECANDEQMEGEGDFAVKQAKKMKTENPSEAHTDQRAQKRKHTAGDAEKLAEQSTKKRKGKKKKDKSSIKMNVHSDILVSETVVNNRSEETQGSKDCVKSQTLKLGTGKQALTGKEVTIGYTGKLQDGTVFGTTGKKRLMFKLGDHKVIEGVDTGIVGMCVGGQRKLTIPPSLGFGDVKMGKIPVNSTLEIDVELFKVVD